MCRKKLLQVLVSFLFVMMVCGSAFSAPDAENNKTDPTATPAGLVKLIAREKIQWPAGKPLTKSEFLWTHHPELRPTVNPAIPISSGVDSSKEEEKLLKKQFAKWQQECEANKKRNAQRAVKSAGIMASDNFKEDYSAYLYKASPKYDKQVASLRKQRPEIFGKHREWDIQIRYIATPVDSDYIHIVGQSRDDTLVCVLYPKALAHKVSKLRPWMVRKFSGKVVSWQQIAPDHFKPADRRYEPAKGKAEKKMCLFLNCDGIADSKWQPTYFWGLKGEANKVLYLLDYSGSMFFAGNIRRQYVAVHQSLSRLCDKQWFMIMVFEGGKPWPVVGWALASDRNKQKALSKLEQYMGEGQADALEMMKRAVRLVKRDSVVYLCADGYSHDFSVKSSKTTKLKGKLKRWGRRAKSPVNIIFYDYDLKKHSILKWFAGLTKGTCIPGLKDRSVIRELEEYEALNMERKD